MYLENLTKNLTATGFGLFVLQDNLPTANLGEHSLVFLLLTITIPSVISGIVTVLIEYFKSRRK